MVRALREHDFHQVAYVPDAGHAHLISRCVEDPSLTAVTLTTEEEGVALAAGAWLGGQRAALLLQSSGVGNCVNLFSLLRTCRVPLLLLVTMRGQYGEANPWQVPMGQLTGPVLRLAGFVVLEADDEGRVAETVDAAATMAASGAGAVAVLIGQRAVGAKAFAAAGEP
ncbi:MAG: phosphonopyruvate decarboxylase [Acidimicrobiia bacterium]|nr:phosphonopyruvate decarboxylase [Acidimicrobiia bacterium]